MKTQVCLLTGAICMATLGPGLGQVPVITIQPTNQTACAGTEAPFVVGVTGADPLFYQWRSSTGGADYSDLPGCTNATLVITNVQASDSLYYQAVITNAQGQQGNVTDVIGDRCGEVLALGEVTQVVGGQECPLVSEGPLVIGPKAPVLGLGVGIIAGRFPRADQPDRFRRGFRGPGRRGDARQDDGRLEG